MAGIQRTAAADPIAKDAASVLRHDLITPINLIVGYCDLLISEVPEPGRSSRVIALQSIRGTGFELLALIDQVLLAEAIDRTVGNLRVLARSIPAPAEALIRTCDALDAKVRGDEAIGTSDFREDLAKIRTAGARMIELASLLASDLTSDDGTADVPTYD